MEQKFIPNSTNVTINGVDRIRTFYNGDGVPNIIEAFIAEDVANINGVPYIEGELLITANNFPEEVNYWLDDQGNLILQTIDADALNYSINEDGELEHTV